MAKRYNHHAGAQGPRGRRELMTKRTRIRDVTRMILDRPDATQTQIAARLGCSQQAVSVYVREMFHEMFEVDKTEAKHKLILRVNQFKRLYSEALIGLERSKQGTERVTTEYVPTPCRVCGGKGTIRQKVKGGFKDCAVCDGSGTRIVEHVTRQMMGQAGDSSFVNAAANVLRLQTKLEGLYRPDVVDLKDRPQINVNIDWSRVSDDDLLRVRSVLAMARPDYAERPALEAKSLPVTGEGSG